MLSGFGQSNGDGLFSTLHLSSRSSAFQLATLEFVHRSSNIFLRLAAIFASHVSFFLSLDVTSEIAAFLAIQGDSKGFPSIPVIQNLNVNTCEPNARNATKGREIIEKVELSDDTFSRRQVDSGRFE